MLLKMRLASLRKSCIAVAVALACAVALSAPVSTDLADAAVRTWMQTCGVEGMQSKACLDRARAFTTTNGAAFNVVRLQDGGFVVTSSDTEIEPIIAFSADSEFAADSANPLWVMLSRDLAARAKRIATKAYANAQGKAATRLSEPAEKWARLTRGATLGGGLGKMAVEGSGAKVSDVRAGPLLDSKWGQDGPCFNYYTPNGYPCGCVATAAAQIMRYFRYPTGSVAPRTNTCLVQSGTTDLGFGYYTVQYSYASLSMQGGTYDWSSMPAKGGSRTTKAQCEAIGKLTSDVGIACYMQYAEHGSATGGYMAAPALKDVFGYANALPIIAEGATFSSDVLKAVLIPNLDAKLPVLTSVDGADGGHAVVADGYGYNSGSLYVHFNMGWEGEGDAWYAPPNVDDFTAVDGFVYNIYPTGRKGDVICSGRVLAAGRPVSGAKVSVANPGSHTRGRCTTDSNGVYALILAPGTHEITAESLSGQGSRAVTLKACVGTGLSGTSYYVNKLGSVGNVCGFDLTLTSTNANLVRLDANGGVCEVESVEREAGEKYGDLPTATRKGYEFLGWFTDPTGGDEVTSNTLVMVGVTLYAHWRLSSTPGDDPDTCVVRFVTDGDGPAPMARGVKIGSAIGTLPSLVAKYGDSGPLFEGWRDGSGARVTSGTIANADMTLYAVWSERYWHARVSFDAGGGAGQMDSVYFDVDMENEFSERYTLPKCAFTRPGYLFAAWGVECGCSLPGDEDVYLAGMPIEIGGCNYALTATWIRIGVAMCDVVFDANGGSVSPKRRTVESGAAVGELPVPTRTGYTFVGWFTASCGGSQVYATTIVRGGVTYYAHWKRESGGASAGPRLYDDVYGAAPTYAASEYNGYLFDENGAAKGTIQLKVGKPNARSGLASVKATVVVGAKKATLAAVTMGKTAVRPDGPTTVALVGRGAAACEVTFGADGLSGTYGSYEIDGARNFFASKNGSDQILADAVAHRLGGSYNVVWSGGVASLALGKKGKVKATATLADGRKLTSNAALLIGEELCCVPVSLPKAELSFVVWIEVKGAGDTNASVVGLGDDAVVGCPRALADGAALRLDRSDALWGRLGGEALTDYLPDGVSVSRSGAKWIVAGGAKAGRLTMKGGVLDTSKAGANPAWLKLMYSAKDGSFKGSFKAYTVSSGKLKAITVSVSGVMIGSKGYGAASVKKVGSCSLVLE